MLIIIKSYEILKSCYTIKKRQIRLESAKCTHAQGYEDRKKNEPSSYYNRSSGIFL